MKILKKLRFLLPVLIFALIRFGGLALISLLFSRLFAAWGLTSLNYTLAPGWAQAVVRCHTPLAYILISLLICAALKPFLKPKTGRLARGLLLGLLAGGFALGMTFLFDSARVQSGPAIVPELLLGFLANAAVWMSRAALIAAVYELLPPRFRKLACLAGLLSVSSILAPAVWLNALLMGLAMTLLYEKDGTRGAACFGAAAYLFGTLLFAMPNASVYCTPVFTLYHVSDELLTGGSAGMYCGLWFTLALTAVNACLILRKKR